MLEDRELDESELELLSTVLTTGPEESSFTATRRLGEEVSSETPVSEDPASSREIDGACVRVTTGFDRWLSELPLMNTRRERTSALAYMILAF